MKKLFTWWGEKSRLRADRDKLLSQIDARNITIGKSQLEIARITDALYNRGETILEQRTELGNIKAADRVSSVVHDDVKDLCKAYVEELGRCHKSIKSLERAKRKSDKEVVGFREQLASITPMHELRREHAALQHAYDDLAQSIASKQKLFKRHPDDETGIPFMDLMNDLLAKEQGLHDMLKDSGIDYGTVDDAYIVIVELVTESIASRKTTNGPTP